jgi:hypothetical protein
MTNDSATSRKMPFRAPKRFLVDTNIWSGIADADLSTEVVGAMKRHRVEILVAPSVLYELLRTPNDAVRARFANVITAPYWKRLMPETFLETKEFHAEIRRLRPQWLRSTPKRARYMQIFHDWKTTSGMWKRSRETPAREAGFINQLGGSTLVMARNHAKNARQQSDKLKATPQPLDKVFGVLPMAVEGWNGEPVEAWRLAAYISLTPLLGDPEHEYTIWLDADVDVVRMLADRASYVKFWLYDVEAIALPRCWLRWAFDYLQAFHKVTDGTPCDTQLSTYLPDADVVLSSDGGFIDRVNECRKYAPCALPFAERLSKQRPQNAYDLIRRIEASQEYIR